MTTTERDPQTRLAELPLFRGGQGRSDADVRSDGETVLGLVVLACTIGAAVFLVRWILGV